MKKSIFSLVVLMSIFGTTASFGQRTRVYVEDDMYVPTREVHISNLSHRSTCGSGRVVEVRRRPAAYKEVRYAAPARVEVVRPVHHRTVVVPAPVPAPAPVVVHHSSSAATGMVVGAAIGAVVGALIH